MKKNFIHEYKNYFFIECIFLTRQKILKMSPSATIINPCDNRQRDGSCTVIDQSVFLIPNRRQKMFRNDLAEILAVLAISGVEK
jgi:hypothetical protein